MFVVDKCIRRSKKALGEELLKNLNLKLKEKKKKKKKKNLK
jgi:hypothetical protein